MSADIRLDFGPVGASLDLVDADQLADQRPFWFSTIADGFNLGSPTASRIIVASLMRDGDDERIDRYGNRTITLDVQVHARTPHDLGLGEKALGRLVGTRTLLRWTPPGDVGSLTRFVVLTSEMVQVPNDLDEMREIRTRTWRLTLTCEPHGTSAAQVSQTFAPSTVEPGVVDNASSLARWSADGAGLLSTSTYGDGTSIRDQVTVTPGSLNSASIRYAGPAAPSGNFIAIDVAGSTGVRLAGGILPVAVEPGASYTRYWFENPGTATILFTLSLDLSGETGTVTREHSFYVGGLYASATLNARGMVVTDVDGSVRTEGTLAITRATVMSWVIAYADPAMQEFGYSPAVPATWGLAPAGEYALYVKSAATGSAAGTIVATITDESGLVQSATTVVRAATAGFRPVGKFVLGSKRNGLLGPLTVAVTHNGSAVASPEFRLFRVKRGETSLTAYEGTGVTELALEPPSLENPLGALWAGGYSAESRAVSLQVPTMPAGPVAIHVEANNSPTAPVTTTVSYWPRWKTFAP